MSSQSVRLPLRKWSIVALGSTAMATVLFSYLLAVVVALVFLLLPLALFVFVPVTSSTFLFGRLLLSVFGVAVGLTILWSLLPQEKQLDINGVRIYFSKEPRLAGEIASIAAALREPMPSEVYLLADANAFVTEKGGVLGLGNRRVMGLGLPLLQMLSIAQFRAVLAHEFGHYYAGDTRLGPWVYNTRSAMLRVFHNLGRKSDIIRFLTRWAIVALLYRMLMAAMRGYWRLFMRITQAISRRQESRSDELACYVAGSQALVDGLENIEKCHAGLSSYWTSFVLPVALSGYQPALAQGFLQFMQAPQIAKATSDFLAQRASTAKSSPYDTHPPLNKRIEQAKRYDLPYSGDSAASSGLPAISLIDDLGPLETGLLNKLIPVTAAADLKPLDWQTAGTDIYIPLWRKEIAEFLPFLSTKKLADFPLLVLDPKLLAGIVPNPPGVRLNQNQRIARAHHVLFCAFALCLVDNGWKLTAEPGNLVLVRGESKIDPGVVVGLIRTGKLSVVEWSNYRTQHEMGNWQLASTALAPVTR
jgi:heat shock protein HtpX